MLCGLVVFLPETFARITEWGFRRYTKYEPGNMSLILTAPHGGNLNPSRQSTGEMWPNRIDYGCKGKDGKCIWTHNCGITSKDCKTRKLSDLYTVEITQDIADRIKEITGEELDFRYSRFFDNLLQNKVVLYSGKFDPFTDFMK